MRETIRISAQYEIHQECIDARVRFDENNGYWIADFPIAGTQKVTFTTINGVECAACAHPSGKGFIFVTLEEAKLEETKEGCLRGVLSLNEEGESVYKISTPHSGRRCLD